MTPRALVLPAIALLLLAAACGSPEGDPGPSGSGGSSSSSGPGGAGGGGSGGGAVFTPDAPPQLGKGKTYHVSPSGDDQNDGLAPDRAWKTLDRVSGASFAAGDNLLLEGGATFSGKLTLGSDDGGTATAPISVSSYGTGRATIDAGAGNGIDVYNVAGVQIWELDVRGAYDAASQTGNDGLGISCYMDLPGGQKLEYLVLDRVDVSGFKKGGVSVGAWPTDGTKGGFKNVRITSVSAHGNGEFGISSWGYFDIAAAGWAHEDLVVRGCRTFDNPGIGGKGAHSGSGIVLGDVHGALVEHNISWNNGANNDNPGGGPVGIWAWDSDQVVIQRNESYGNRSKTLDGGGFDIDGGTTNSILQYNYSHDNEGPGLLIAQFGGARPMKNNVMRYNVSENDCRDDDGGAINFWNGNGAQGIDGFLILNNTIFLSPGKKPAAALNFLSGTKGVKIVNNLFVTTEGMWVVDVVSGQEGLEMIGNAYWSSGATLVFGWAGGTYAGIEGFRGASGQEKGTGMVVDPGLVAPGGGGTIGEPGKLGELSAYRLGPSSPLIDAAVLPETLGIDPGKSDFFGTSLPQGKKFDVGAHERAQEP